MSYIDGFVAAVPTAGKEVYRQHATKSAAWFKDRGALKVVETWGDDVPDGKVTSFPMAVRKKDDETVVFSWVVWPDKATRDAAYRSMGSADMSDLPFDGQRLIYGGFEPLLEA